MNPRDATYHVVFHKPFADVEAGLGGLKALCDAMLGAEHPADDEVKTTHCHFVINGIKTRAITTRSACETIRKHIPDTLKGQGQYFVSDRTTKTRELYDWEKTCIYILKGQREYLKFRTDNITDEMIEEWLTLGFLKPKPTPQNKEETQKKKEYTQWDLIKEVRRDGIRREVLVKRDIGLIPITVIDPCKENYDLMIQKLEEHRIRTSQNEMERIWLTIIREDPNIQSALYQKFMNKFLNH